jgi:hypothetical protein
LVQNRGILPGDLMLIFHAKDDDTTTPMSTPTGWSKSLEVGIATGNDRLLTMFSRRATGHEAYLYRNGILVNDPSTTFNRAAGIIIVRNVAWVTSLGMSGHAAEVSTGSSHGSNDFTPAAQTSGSATPENGHVLYITVHVGALNSGSAAKNGGAPPGCTLAIESQSELGAVSGIFLEVATMDSINATQFNPGSWTGTADDATSEYTLMTLTLLNGMPAMPLAARLMTMLPITTKDISPITTTSTAVGLTKNKAVTLGQALETDAATGLTKVKNKLLTPVTELDTGITLTKNKVKSLSPITETDLANALSKVKQLSLTPITEADTAISQDADKHVTIVAATELDQAIGLTGTVTIAITPATETDLAVGLTAHKAVTLIPIEEEDVIVLLGLAGQPFHVELNPIMETDLAVALVAAKTLSITPTTEQDSAQALSRLKRSTLVPVTENDLAILLHHAKQLSLSPILETNIATALHLISVLLARDLPFTAETYLEVRTSDTETLREWQ